MITSLDFLYVVFFISIALHVLAMFNSIAFVLPLQFKESGVKNGLVTLRKQLLAKGIFAIVIDIVSIIALTSRYFINDPDISRYVIVTVIFLHAVGQFAKSVIDTKIYHSQYSPENTELHKIAAEIEARRHKKAKS